MFVQTLREIQVKSKRIPLRKREPTSKAANEIKAKLIIDASIILWIQTTNGYKGIKLKSMLFAICI